MQLYVRMARFLEEHGRVRFCKLSKNIENCAKSVLECRECQFHSNCDYVWIDELWKKYNELLSPPFPIVIKTALEKGRMITLTGEKDFCMFSVPIKKPFVVINDICVDESLRGQGTATKLLKFLMGYFDKDIFAKCKADTGAEKFWSKVGKRIPATSGKVEEGYEIVGNNSKMAWYLVENINKKSFKEELF